MKQAEKTYIMDAGFNERCSLCMCHSVSLLSNGRVSKQNVIDSIRGAPFEDVVGAEDRWNERKDEVKLCDYCNTFVFDFATRHRRKRHPLHLVIDHIVSGACAVPAPSKTQLARWIQEMDSKHPILLSTKGLDDRIHAVRLIDPQFSHQSVSLVRWLFEGASHLFYDMELGRNIRRLVTDPRFHRFWEAWPSACRRCNTSQKEKHSDGKLIYPDFAGYSSALLFAGSTASMQSEFECTIERQPVVAGLTLFCLRCNQVSAISFEYESAMRNYFTLPTQTSGGHYALIAIRHHRRFLA
jgi:hypothetical protein